MLTDAVATALERIEADRTGAVVTVCQAALHEARPVDGSLAGVPFTAKDVLATRGVPSQAGTRALAGHVPAEDAPAVARLRDAGAVLVGKTNCSELALSPWTGNPLFGETRHPFAPGRSPGGSSGGCAAAIAAGLVPLGVGTDYGGSVRLPAAACGIVALRPSAGRVPSAGQLPPSPESSPRHAFSLVGPLAIDIDHLHAALAALDPLHTAPLPSPDALAPVAIGGDDARVRAAADVLGCPTVEPPPFLVAAEDCFTALRELDTYDDLRPLADRLGPELQALIDRSPRSLDVREHERLNQDAQRLRRQADEFMSLHPVLILPVTRGELPPPAGAPVPFDHLGPCRAVSLLGLPAVAAGRVQLVARPGRDEEALAVAALLTDGERG
jgi:Asp-tRNA(Asn)/Glu-tRNA(Gln) amidotransferase A subunit family amidase